MVTSSTSSSKLKTSYHRSQRSSSGCGTASLVLYILKAAKPSDLSKKWRVALNPPHGKHPCKYKNIRTAAEHNSKA